MTGAIRPALSSFPGTPWAPPDPGGPHCPLRLGLLSQFKNFGGLSGFCITFTALFPLLILPSSGGKTAVSQLAQTTYSVVKIVNNERAKGKVYKVKERERRQKREIEKERRKEREKV